MHSNTGTASSPRAFSSNFLSGSFIHTFSNLLPASDLHFGVSAMLSIFPNKLGDHDPFCFSRNDLARFRSLSNEYGFAQFCFEVCPSTFLKSLPGLSGKSSAALEFSASQPTFSASSQSSSVIIVGGKESSSFAEASSGVKGSEIEPNAELSFCVFSSSFSSPSLLIVSGIIESLLPFPISKFLSFVWISSDRTTLTTAS
mmetsp:Transcript_27030/g.37618  ORF Transcript_27030/g.37618 Transcript_27030/m.37618 type:complete len:200 (-) Transcript_27030:357-956(-)